MTCSFCEREFNDAEMTTWKDAAGTWSECCRSCADALSAIEEDPLFVGHAVIENGILKVITRSRCCLCGMEYKGDASQDVMMFMCGECLARETNAPDQGTESLTDKELRRRMRKRWILRKQAEELEGGADDS